MSSQNNDNNNNLPVIPTPVPNIGGNGDLLFLQTGNNSNSGQYGLVVNGGGALINNNLIVQGTGQVSFQQSVQLNGGAQVSGNIQGVVNSSGAAPVLSGFVLESPSVTPNSLNASSIQWGSASVFIFTPESNTLIDYSSNSLQNIGFSKNTLYTVINTSSKNAFQMKLPNNAIQNPQTVTTITINANGSFQFYVNGSSQLFCVQLANGYMM